MVIVSRIFQLRCFLAPAFPDYARTDHDELFLKKRSRLPFFRECTEKRAKLSDATLCGSRNRRYCTSRRSCVHSCRVFAAPTRRTRSTMTREYFDTYRVRCEGEIYRSAQHNFLRAVRATFLARS